MVRAARMESDYYGVENEGVTNPDLEYIEGAERIARNKQLKRP